MALNTPMDTNNEQSFERVVAEYDRLVHAAVRRVVRSNADVDDVVQETWLTYLRHGHQVRHQAALGSWLFRVATRLAVRTSKAAGRDIFLDEAGLSAQRALTANEGDVEARLWHEQRRTAVDQATRNLCQRDRQVLGLMLDDGSLSYREISARAGVPVGSLGPTRERLIRKLRNMAEIQRLTEGEGTAAVAVMRAS